MSLDATPLHHPTLTADQLLPNVAFTEAETGKEWRPAQLRQRAAQLLCFCHPDCADCSRVLAALAERAEDLRWADTRVHVVFTAPAESPFPVLLDAHGEARARVLGPDGVVPTLVVADRFTALAEVYPAPDHDFPDPDDVLTALRLLACDCE